MFHGYIGLGFRFAFRRRRNALFTVLSIMISVSLLYSTMSVTSLVRVNTSDYIRKTSSPVDISISSTKYSMPITEQMTSEIGRYPHIVATVPRIEEIAQFANGSNWIHLILLGLDTSREQDLGSFAVSAGSDQINSSYCFLSDSAMALLNQSIGDTIALYTSAGIHLFQVSGYGNAIDKGIIGPVVFIDLRTAWDIFSIRYPNNSSNKLLVKVDDVFEIPSTVQELSRIYGTIFVISNEKSYSLWIASQFLTQAESVLFLITIIVFAIAAIRIFSSYMLIFSERRYETGILLALGSGRREVLVSLLCEILTVGFLGATVGILLGFIGSVFISQITSISLIIQSPVGAAIMPPPGLVIDFVAVVVSLVAGIMVTGVAGLVPALIAVRQPVIESLRYSISSAGAPASLPRSFGRVLRWVLVVFGVALSLLVSVQILSDVLGLGFLQSDAIRYLSIPAFLMLIAGFSTVLSRSRFLISQVSKKVRPAVAKLLAASLKRRFIASLLIFNLFVSVSMMFFVSVNISTTITSHWEHTVGWRSTSANVVVYVDNSVPLTIQDVVKNLRGVDETTALASTIQFMRHETKVQNALVFGVEPSSFQNLASVGLIQAVNMSAGFRVLGSQDSCIISDYAAKTLGVGLGDWLEVGARANLTVVAICESSAPVFLFSFINPLFVFVNSASWDAVSPDPYHIQGILMRSDDANATVSALSEYPGLYPVLISNIINDYSSAVKTLQTMMDSTMNLILLIAGLSAILSGWSTSVTRRREIGMLRALGMRSRDIAASMSLESGLPMLFGACWGMIIGLIANVSISDVIIRFSGGPPVLFDVRALVLVLFALLTSIIALFLSVMRGTRSSTIDLLNDRQRR